MDDSEVESGSVLDTVEVGRTMVSGTPPVVPTSSSSKVVEISEAVSVVDVGCASGKRVEVFPSSMTIVLETTTVFTIVGDSDTGSKIDDTSVIVVELEDSAVAKVLLETWRLTCFGK